ncbi:MAG: cyanophycin synthetase, partial [Proteobacteria bacterium]
MTKIKIDASAEIFLRNQGRELSSIPALGEHVQLRNTANLSKGATAIDVTDEVHSDIRFICERAARIAQLDVCGIDLIAEDISQPASGQSLGIIEVNAAPGIRMHHYPTVGQPRDAGGAIVDHLFPNPAQARIPIVSITGTNGKTTVTRMIAHGLKSRFDFVGMTNSSGIYINEHLIQKGDTTGPHSARMILDDPSVNVAVLETARGGILRRGIGFDWSDVGVITNVQPDHIGQDGIESVQDILKIKAVIAEQVRDGGTLVLNADDELVLSLLDRPSVRAEHKRVMLFSMDSSHPRILAHVQTGGTAFVFQDGQIVEMQGDVSTARPIMAASLIKSTIGATSHYQISNSLAATAALRALELDQSEISQGLSSFDSITNNAGRANLYRVGKGFVMVDYGHNP